jgi:hypothetical protein
VEGIVTPTELLDRAERLLDEYAGVMDRLKRTRPITEQEWIEGNIAAIDAWKRDKREMKEQSNAESIARSELVRQMRERASFADTTASLCRLISTWADVLEGKESTGWAAMNRTDLASEAERG